MTNNKRNWLLHLFLLSNVAIAHPLFQQVSRQSEFFVAHDVGTFELLSTTLLLSFAIALGLFALELLAGIIHPKFARILHASFLFLLVALFLLPLLKKAPALSGYGLILVALFLAASFVVLYHKSKAAFQTLTLLSPLALAVPVLFLLHDSIRTLLAESKPPILHKTVANTPVILVLFDELPLNSLLDETGKIDDVRFPNFARLATESNWYRNTTTCSSLTDIAVPAILTGNYPEQSRLPVVQEYPENLFTLLGGTYDLHVREDITMLNPRRLEDQPHWNRLSILWKDMAAIYLHLVVPYPFTEHLPEVTETWGNFWDEEKIVNRAQDFRAFINEIPRYHANKSLHFAHIMLPHKPWVYLPSGREYRDYGSLGWGTSHTNRGVWLDDPEVVTHFQRRHLLQVGFLDRLVGELVERLKTTGMYDSALLIVSSDHGIGFAPGESLRKPSEQTLQDILYVPLFVKLPGQTAGAIHDDVVETVDILPTVADVLNLEIPWKVVGRSALKSAHAKRRQRSRLRATNQLVKYRSNFSPESPSLQRRLKQIGARSGFETFFSFSPPTVESGAPHGKRPKAWILDRDAYENVDLRSNFLPAYVSGVVQAPANSDPFTLQILVNGVTRAVTRTFPAKRGKIRFGALVPESSFQQGKNKIEVNVLN